MILPKKMSESTKGLGVDDSWTPLDLFSLMGGRLWVFERANCAEYADEDKRFEQKSRELVLKTHIF